MTGQGMGGLLQKHESNVIRKHMKWAIGLSSFLLGLQLTASSIYRRKKFHLQF